MVLRQLPASDSEESVSNVELGLAKGKEAVSLDTRDGVSWSILGGLSFSLFSILVDYMNIF